MSLSSLLLAPGKDIDTELDALFKSNPPAKPQNPSIQSHSATSIVALGPSKSALQKKRKLPTLVNDKESTRIPPKRPKSSPAKKQDIANATITAELRKGQDHKGPGDGTSKGDRKSSNRGRTRDVAKEVEDEENSDLEDAYLRQKNGKSYNQTNDDSHSDSGSDDGNNNTLPVHESLQKDSKNKSVPKTKKTLPENETPEMRDRRTIFIGNLSAEVAQKRTLLKQLRRHILSQIPASKIESTRFRSIAFQSPTSKLPTGDRMPQDAAYTAPMSSKSARTHDRASAWRDHKGKGKSTHGGDADEEGGKSSEKKYLNPNQKKKIAFINQEFHSTADTVHAYIVFAHPLSVESRPANVPPPPPTMNPYEAALLAKVRCDGTLFLDRILRVDVVGKTKEGGGTPAEASGNASIGGVWQEMVETDPKLSVFVGNLDFASKEEDLRVFFDGVVCAERGPPDMASSPIDKEEENGHEGVKKLKTWVTRVRIVRDKETQLGKGFGYVQFVDRQCVDEVLALQLQLKFAKRKLRMQRCKTLPGVPAIHKVPVESKDSSKSAKPITKPASVPVIVPKGNPGLGEKLKHLPKEVRKQYKSTDADRVARRLAKKKARLAMAVGEGGVKIKGKVRERVRNKSSTITGKKKESVKGTKRVRSDMSLSKRSMKK